MAGISGKTTIGISSMPITKVGDTSTAATTTFTETTAIDGTAWDLSAVVAGMYAVTSDGFAGIITVVNDGTDTITVRDWIHKTSGQNGQLPADGSSVTIHKVWKCEMLSLRADEDNGANIHIQRNGADATTNEFVVSAGEGITLYPIIDGHHVDATKINAISASGNLVLWFITDAE